MHLNFDNLHNQLTKSPLFSKASPIDIARLIPYIQEKNFESGDTIFKTGSEANFLYLIKYGSIQLISQAKLIHYFDQSNKQKKSLVGHPVYSQIQHGFFGTECGLQNYVYHSDAVTSSKTSLLIIPKEPFQQFIENNKPAQKQLEISFLNHYSQYQSKNEIQISSKIKESSKKESYTWKIVGWSLAILLPIFILLLDSTLDTQFEAKQKHFFMILSATITMWIFQLTAEFIPPIFAILAILTLDISPPSIALSGFTAGSFFMAMSIFSIAILLKNSGFAYRIVLNILQHVPHSQFSYSLTTLILGILITPIFPSANGRIILAIPLLNDIIDSIKYKYQGKAATRLSVSIFTGFCAFSAIFLSSKSINFAIYTLFPLQIREQFTWLGWTLAALPVAFLLLISYFVLDLIIFRNSETPKLPPNQIKSQIAILGPMSKQEWSTLISIFLFFIGIATSSIHKIEIPWIGFTILYFILALNFLGKETFQKNIDWPFLIYLATLIGLSKSMFHVGINNDIIALFEHYPLQEISLLMQDNFYLFTFLFCVFIMLFRLLIPNNAAVIILASIFFPIAQNHGINVWVIGFIILFICDSWIFGYQSTYYILFKDKLSKKNIYNNYSFSLFFIIINLLKIFIVLIAVSYWQFINIL